MKHLKTYELSKQKMLYKVGDYVLFFNPDTQTKLTGQVMSVEEKSITWPYRIYYGEKRLGLFAEREIIRKLTPEEIEEFEMKKSINKYNI